MNNREFRYKFLLGLLNGCFNSQKDNIDFKRFNIGLFGQIKRYIKDYSLFIIWEKFGFVRKRFNMEATKHHLRIYTQNMDKLEEVYNLLGDEYSKSLFIELLLFRTLNAHHIKLSINTKSFKTKRLELNKQYLEGHHTIDTGKSFLNRYKLEGVSGTIDLHSYEIHRMFLWEHYAYRREGKCITVEPEDIVIDGGACWGNSTLYFADKVGERGKVYAFEFEKFNLGVFDKNLRQNTHLASRIEIMEYALWNITGETLNYSSDGPGTSINSKESQSEIRQTSTITIDDVVMGKGIPKVDFIKMDIEGSEFNALIGAKQTIQTFKPKLAISIYHKIKDFYQIPLWINELDLGYEFYVDHFSIHSEETVLFAHSKLQALDAPPSLVI